MVTTKLEPGVLFSFRRGGLTLESRTKETGKTKVSIPISFDDTADFKIDVSFMKDYLRSLEADAVIDIYMVVDDDPVLFETGDGNYRYVVMPLSRDKSEVAEPDADTGIEDVGQVSTVEESMKKVDEAPIPDNDMETKVFQLLQENGHLQTKVEQYRVLLDRAMRLIERIEKRAAGVCLIRCGVPVCGGKPLPPVCRSWRMLAANVRTVNYRAGCRIFLLQRINDFVLL